ncbi:MAG: lipopolysaccharide assembly protein LapB [Formosimonas sp.]
MDFEAEWLLTLPVFFALGWWAARLNYRSQMAQTRQLPRAYFKGLNFLLDQEPDKAIDELIDVARVDTGAIDLYFTLGHLFAQRGEIARAIRVYQSLLERADLPEKARLRALHQLGLVFLQGGLFDRAEHCFQTLRDTELHDVAMQQLLLIYQSQQEWRAAIEVAQHMPRTPDNATALLHFHCECALAAMKQNNHVQAESEISAALALRPNSVRAQLLQAQSQMAQGKPAQAVRLLSELAAKQPDAYPLLVNDLLAAHKALGEPEVGVRDVYAQALATGSVDVLNAWLAAQDPASAQTGAQLEAVFARHPSLNALDKVLQQRLQHDSDEAAQQETRAMQGLIKKQVQQLSRYRCASCGFEAAHYYWQCPACTRWETYPPKRLEELEQAKRSRGQVNGY